MVTIQVADKIIILDEEDFKSLPSGHYFKLDKDGYPLLYFYSKETRREENVRLGRWVMHNPKGLLVDHINHNILDNRRCNLRATTAAQNSRNRRPHKNTTSRFKGVCRTRSGKWQAQIKVDLKSVYLGMFDDELEAAKAYNEAARKAYGEYAYLNPVSWSS